MNDNCFPDENMRLRIMAYLDGELSAEENSEVERMIAGNPRYRKHYDQLKQLKEVTGAMKFKILPDMYWDEYWHHVFNRIERGISWILISLGAIIVLSFAAWSAIGELLADRNVNSFVKFGILILVVGVVILFISVVREKLMVRKVDKYTEVQR
jgi:hypothetical protein